MTGVERERKFLVATPPEDIDRYPSSQIEQGYLVIGDDGSEARVRQRAEQKWLTVKRGAGLVRQEEEVEISAEQFERLWPLTEGRRVSKTRYKISLADGLVLELDIYHGSLAGLVTAEVEFPDADAANRFVPPSWVGAEVTTVDAYKNRRLAIDGRPRE
jgi:CYTH domain-containing protein